MISFLSSFLYFLSSFSFISVHPTLSFSPLFHFLAIFFSQNFLSFFSNFLSLSSQFFLCCVRVSSFAVWVWLWVWWVITVVVMLWVWWVISFGSCHGCEFVPWCLWVLSWGLCGRSLASWSCRGCGGSSFLGHAVGVGCRGFYFCGCGLIFLSSCGLILVVVVVGCVK